MTVGEAVAAAAKRAEKQQEFLRAAMKKLQKDAEPKDTNQQTAVRREEENA
ncbi:UNVERIFIED_ORG: hypothetical protein J2W74_002216 [Methylorubrum zatmanii]